MRINIKKIISRILIVLGISIIGINYYTIYKVEKENKNIVLQYEKSINSGKKMQEVIKLNEDIVGILKIPKINLEVAVKEGTDKETLKYAVGHFEQTAMPGEDGNFSVAGHRAYTTNKFFSNLDKLEIGDELNMLYMDTTHSYKVNSIEVVEPDEVEVVDSMDKDKKEITLVTCTPKFSGTHRLVVKGTYVQ
ncbi:MAG: class D sortase [Romboutsia sp.]